MRHIDLDAAADAAVLCIIDGHGRLDWWAERLVRLAAGDADVMFSDMDGWRAHLRNRLETCCHAFAGLVLCEICGHTDLHPIHRGRGREHALILAYNPAGDPVCRECLHVLPEVAEWVFMMDEPEPADPLG